MEVEVNDNILPEVLLKVVETGCKVDFHIHSKASKHKESDDCVDLSTKENIEVLIEKLNDRNINMCSISDHDNFDFELYKKLKQQENKGSIKKVFPAVEFSVTYDGKVLHVITIFDDSDERKISSIQDKIFDIEANKPYYDDECLHSFSEDKFLSILRNIGVNVVMIAHQKETLSSSNSRTHDVMSLGQEKFDELVFIDYFESFEFKSKRNEIFNKYYIEKNKSKYNDVTLRFITGSDCHTWSDYPEENNDFSFTYLKCLPSFRGLAMSVTNVKRINYVNNFFSTSDLYLKSINLEIAGNSFDVKLSKGINVIIGDNSIGKSLLIHKLTNYIHLDNEELKRNYEKYLNEKSIKVLSVISENDIAKFDGQGSIRKMFEDKNFDADSFLSKFFGDGPLINRFIENYKQNVEDYISSLKNKESFKNAYDRLINIKLEILEANSKTINFKKIPQVFISQFTVKIIGTGKIVQNLQSVNSLIDKILQNSYFDEDDKRILEDTKKINSQLISKYNLKIKNLNNEVSMINIINDIFDYKNREFTKTRTNETEKITNYETSKDTFVNNLISCYFLSKNNMLFSPKIVSEKVPTTSKKIGNYRFVSKSGVFSTSNEHFIALLRSVLGKSIKNINDITSSTIPDKFSNRGSAVSYNDKLANLKNDLNSAIDNAFKIQNAINDALDKDVTKELSAGFNSRIYFDLISNQSEEKRIYIIDQPEDDVSQTAIKKSILKDFYDMGRNRQIIMITHNPQFIVNLDVDNVIFIGKNESGKIYIQNGALEYFDDDYDILQIVADNIEGGIDSINERWKRYEKNIYDV